jgi:hypothetical protein
MLAITTLNLARGDLNSLSVAIYLLSCFRAKKAWIHVTTAVGIGWLAVVYQT